MARCEYEHQHFTDSTAHRGDGSEQCWLKDKPHVTAFRIGENREQHFCLFHAPDDASSIHGSWPISDRGKAQSKLLRELLDEWNGENIAKQEKKSFVLPGIHCGDIELSYYKFSHDIELTDATFTGYARFDGATFTGYARFDGATFTEYVEFYKATFTKQAFFHNATFTEHARFSSATFTKDAWFNDATFIEGAQFDKATVTGEALFSNATFSKNAWFGGVTFTGEARFNIATFTGEARFHDAMFYENVGFSNSTFYGNAEFIGATFTKGANFSKVTFTEKAIFDKSTLGNVLDLTDSDFLLGCILNDLNFPQLNLTRIKTSYPFTLTNCDIHKLEYTSHVGEKICFNKVKTGLAENAASGAATFTKPEDKTVPASGTFTFANEDCSRLSFLNMDLSKSFFFGADVSKTRFDSCHWIEPKGKEKYQRVAEHDTIIKEFDKAKKGGIKEEIVKAVERLKLLRSLYRQLMKNLEDNREYATAGDFHYREMQLRQMIVEHEGKGVESKILRAYHFFADFGESYKKLGWGIVLSLIATIGFVFGVEAIWNYNRYYFACAVPFVDRLTQITKAVLFGIVPSGLQRAVDKTLVELSFLSQLLIFFETFFVVIVGSLFVMAVNRRFRR